MNESLRDRIIAELRVAPSRLAPIAAKLGAPFSTVYSIASACPEIAIVGKQTMRRGRPISIYGLAGTAPEFVPPPSEPKDVEPKRKFRYPLRICQETDTAAKVAVGIKRVFGRLERNKPLTAFVSKGGVFVTTPEAFGKAASREWIGTYVPSATRRDIYEDYAHHLEGRAAA